MREVFFAIDVGGTFVDVALVDANAGRTWLGKALRTTVDNDDFVELLRSMLASAEVEPADVTAVVHGTTVITNSIIENSGARAALVVTSGFRDLLEIGRHDVPRDASVYRWTKPDRPVSPENVIEIGGRIDSAGEEVAGIDDADLDHLVKSLASMDVESVGVSLVNAHLNPVHETLVERELRAQFPQVHITTSSAVQPVMREFERTLAVALNAVQLPLINDYVDSFESALERAGISTPVQYMQSNGGVVAGEDVRRVPIGMSLSGPAAGLQGAASIAKQHGANRAITLDIGGTSSDIGVLVDGTARFTTEGAVGPWRVRIPMVDVESIGAGGGSIARLGPQGGLEVGPNSAGAWPGPACYGRGGVLPTVTDAHAVLGRLPTRLANGTLTPDFDLARAAIASAITDPLRIDVEEGATAILQVTNEAMAGSVRRASVERGYDVRDFALVPLGGAGCLHAAEVAHVLDIRRVLVPFSPGVLAALGLLEADLTADLAQSFPVVRLDDRHAEEILRDSATEVLTRATEWFAFNQVAPDDRTQVLFVEARYANQGFELLVPMATDSEVRIDVEGLRRSFDSAHREQYTFDLADAPVEVIAVRARLSATVPTHSAMGRQWGDAEIDDEQQLERDVWFSAGGWQTTTVVRRVDLEPGWSTSGPVVIEQPDTNVIVPPEWRAVVQEGGDLELTR